MTGETWFERIWRLITPQLIYFGICSAVDMVVGMYWGYTMADDFISENLTVDVQSFTQALTELLVKYGLLLQCIGALTALFFLVPMYRRDYLKRRFVFDNNGIQPYCWIYIIPVGIFTSLGGNMLLNISDFANSSESFRESQEILFSGPFIVQIIGIGLILPICEEFIYRGLIYMRMRQYLSVNMSIMVSSLIFGIIHGNPAQGMYGFLIGILFAYLFEKYGSLKAPVLAHISANMLSLVLAAAQIDMENSMVMLVLGLASVALAMVGVWLIDKQVTAERVYMSDAVDG